MPIYEYRCQSCNRRSSTFFRTLAETETRTPSCSHCGSKNLSRLTSTFSVRGFHTWHSSATFEPLDENDPADFGEEEPDLRGYGEFK